MKYIALIAILFSSPAYAEDVGDGGGWGLTEGGGLAAGGVVESGSLHLEDDIQLSFGGASATPDARLEWDTSGTHQLQIWMTDVDGIGTDGVPLYWLTGTSTAIFGGDIDLNTNSKQLVLDAGTASNPSWVFGDDDDGTGTGAYRPAANRIRIVTNGVSRFQFDTTNVGYVLFDQHALLYNSTDQLSLGTTCTDGHSYGAGDTCAGGNFQVDGDFNADGLTYLEGATEASGNIKVIDGVWFYAGSSGDFGIQYNINQTPHTAYFAVSGDSRHIVIGEKADFNTDFTFPQQANPTLVWQSADATTPAKRGYIAHDQTDFISTSETGGHKLASGGKGAAIEIETDAPVTLTFAANPGDASKIATGFRVAQRSISGVSGRVTTAGTNCATFDAGDGADVDRYGAAIAVTAGTVFDIDDATADPEEFLTGAGNVVLTANGGNCYDLVVALTLHWRGYQGATVD